MRIDQSYKLHNASHYNDVIWRLKSPASRFFTQSFIQAQIKENIKGPRHWPLCGEFIGTGEFPAQSASNAENGSIWWRHHVLHISQYITLEQKCAHSCSINVLWIMGQVHCGICETVPWHAHPLSCFVFTCRDISYNVVNTSCCPNQMSLWVALLGVVIIPSVPYSKKFSTYLHLIYRQMENNHWQK